LASRQQTLAAAQEDALLGNVGQFRGFSGVGIGTRLCDAVQLVLRHIEERVGHAERPEDPLLQERVCTLTGNDLHQCEQHVDRAAIFPARARLEHQRQLAQFFHHLLVRHPRGQRPAVGACELDADPRLRHGLLGRRCSRPVSDAGGMAQQILDGDLAVGGNR
jgi:hypothetical protein